MILALALLAILALAAIALLVVLLRRSQAAAAGAEVGPSEAFHSALVCATKESRRRFLENARTPVEVEHALAAWKARGLSPDGLLYAEGLQRMGELGAEITEADRARIARADAAWKHGRGLPTIHGRMRS